MSFRNSPQKFRGADAMTTLEASADYIDLVADGLLGLPDSVKVIARNVGATPRTIENWRQRLCGPKGLELLRLCRAYPEIWDRVVRAVEPAHEHEARLRLDEIGRRRAALDARIAERESRDATGESGAAVLRETAARRADRFVWRVPLGGRAAE
jgi:hypothetical protein